MDPEQVRTAGPDPRVVSRLRTAGCVFAEDEARLLGAATTDPHELDALVEQRAAGVPLEHLLGWAEFCGLRVAVGPGVFVPRRRTELLARRAAALAPAGAVVVDLCCGSGAVGRAILERPEAVQVYAVDIDPVAVGCARRNLAPRQGIVLQGDLYAPLPLRLRGRVDVVVANAPYVPSDALDLMPAEARLHEPLVALDGGTEGLDVQRRIAATAAAWLAPGGHLLVETSGRQAERTLALVIAGGLDAHVETSDELGATVVVGVRPEGPGQPSAGHEPPPAGPGRSRRPPR